MSGKRKGLRRLSILVTAQTMGNLNRLADMAGFDSLGRVVDKLTREHMVALRPARKSDMPVKEIVDGLKDLAEDRKSFFQEPAGENDAIFRHDYAVLLAAVKYIEGK